MVAGGAYLMGKKLREKSSDSALALRPAGFVVAGFGLALLATQDVALALPVSS